MASGVLPIRRLSLLTGLAMIFNGEYLAHGPSLFVNILLISFYFFYVMAIDAGIVLFSLSDRQLFIVGATFGLFVEGFFHRPFYNIPPAIGGVNWLAVFVQMVAWGFLATVMAFFIAGQRLRRIEGERSAILLMRLCSALLVLTAMFIMWGASLPPLEMPGSGLIAVLIAVMIAMLIYSKRRARSLPEAHDTRRINVVLWLYVFIEFLVGTFFRLGATPVFVFAGLVLSPYLYLTVLRKQQIRV